MNIDFNQLERAAETLIALDNFAGAAEIYYFMADGDLSLDAGYLGYKLGFCYERCGKNSAAKYWYGRAVQENPEIAKYRDALARFTDTDVLRLVR